MDRKQPPETPASRRQALRATAMGLTVALAPSAGWAQSAGSIALPRPAPGRPETLAAALRRRRSVRSYAGAPLALGALAELLWAAQGISDSRGLRTAPSAGALYPLELYVDVLRVRDVAAGVYRYAPATHRLEPVAPAARALAGAAGNALSVASAPLVVCVAAVQRRTAAKYGERAARYVAFEAGAASQNLALAAASLGLGTVVVGAFDDRAVAAALQLPAQVEPVALMPVGVPGG